MRVLISNDDGIHSRGLKALAGALEDLFEVWVVAPDREQSASSHAISLHRPLRLHGHEQPRWFSVDGTPTDCVYLAVNHVMKGSPPDLVLSGINRGPNLADDVTYSGTVAAAMEGALFRIPSIAFSLRAPSHTYDYAPAAGFARSLTSAVASRPIPHGTLLNVNVPEGPIKGWALTRLGKRNWGQVVTEKIDPRGRSYYWIGGDEMGHENIPGSDCNALYDHGLVSVTPLHLDLTHYRMLEELGDLRVGGFTRSL